MKPSLKKKMKKWITSLLAIFLALFVFRLIYGYQSIPDASENMAFDMQIHNGMESSPSSIRKNYASEKYKLVVGQSPVRIDQKYEKIADIHALSTRFDTEEKQVRKEIEDLEGLIQFENKNGNNGYRRLDLVIGVPPENFDSIYNRLTKIGKVTAKQITKKRQDQ